VKTPTVTLPIDAPALARGVGFFETVWVWERRMIFFDAHFARLRTSCEALDVPGPRASRVQGRRARGAARGFPPGSTGCAGRISPSGRTSIPRGPGASSR
jgi:branched-subunit amino acid aminotransferase/4-amino-4-deoxychorismate lyase